MILLNDFFRIKSTAEKDSTYSVEIEINPSHAIFTGHFPGYPIVPGVCMVQMLKEILGQILKQQLTVKQASQLKFLSVLSPDHNPAVNVELSIPKEDQGSWTVSGRIVAGERVFLKYKMLLVPTPGSLEG